MKHFLICLFVVISPFIAYSQTVEKEILQFAIEQYVKAICDTNSKQIVYLEMLGGDKHCVSNYGRLKVISFNAKKEKRFFSKAIKNTNGLFYTLSIKQLGSDTIDFLFYKCQVNKIGGHFQIHMESGGDAGYIPFSRFVYNNLEGKWNYYSAQEMMYNKCYPPRKSDGLKMDKN